MIWASNFQTIREERVTGFAILETLAAIGLSVTIAVVTGSLRHIAVAAAIAPFLLLRTERSTDYALRLAVRLTSRMEWSLDNRRRGLPAVYDATQGTLFEKPDIGELKSWRQAMAFVASYRWLLPSGWATYRIMAGYGLAQLHELLLLSLLIAALTVIKIAVTLYCLLRHPLETLRSIPANWQRIVLYTDTNTPPEILPGIEHFPRNTRLMNYIKFSNSVATYRRNFTSNFELYWHIKYVVMILPAITYRVSLKSTALIWSPLLWVVWRSEAARDVLRLMTQIVTRGFWKIVRAYSAFVALLFAAKLYIFATIQHWSSAYQSIPGWDVLAQYVVPDRVPVWHLAAFVNALLTWGLYLVADHYWNNHRDGDAIPVTRLSTAFSMTLLVRNVLSLYTSVCALYITLLIGATTRWPHIRLQWTPW